VVSMDLLGSFFMPRRRRNAKSEKPSTIRTREREYERKGLSGALLRHHNKWRQRQARAVKALKATKEFQAVHALDPSKCQIQVQWLRDRLQSLRSDELAHLKLMGEHLALATGKLSSNCTLIEDR